MYLYILASVYVAYKVYQKFSCGMCRSPEQMSDKVVVVTGANTGIGFETALDLARRGARVILACRDKHRGETAATKIIAATGNTKVIFKQLDLASFSSVKTFAEDILNTEPELHVLINNAGVGKLDNSLTTDNLPIETQVNHFSPYLLTKLLLSLLKKSAPSRIINVSSVLHKVGKFDPNFFHKLAKSNLSHRRVYSNTKLANVLFTRKLSKVLEDSQVTVNCLHPGAVATDIFRHQYWIVQFMIKWFFKTPYEGAQTTIHLAVAPELENVTGKYFADCAEVKPSKSALDDDMADKLWELSEKVINEANKPM